MACCAFAVFLLMWLTRPLRWLAVRLGLSGQGATANPAVSWRPGQQQLQLPRRGPASSVVTAVALAFIAGPATAAPLVDDAPATGYAAAFHAMLCGPGREARR
ncbi:hypothetical protein SAMN05660666_01759 [Novosphingobium aromaticivorans]|nr:hypothetical protein [Novosphingobium aromaticivorans]SCY46045.1 hypothetical protein SAMN05660666_01759 [Novosphingobium aromaticivorans]